MGSDGFGNEDTRSFHMKSFPKPPSSTCKNFPHPSLPPIENQSTDEITTLPPLRTILPHLNLEKKTSFVMNSKPLIRPLSEEEPTILQQLDQPSARPENCAKESWPWNSQKPLMKILCGPQESGEDNETSTD
eukprot:TRINITY_DN4074_c0_g1_i1.p1 TRINITY_DN4074_c0_g1~~TRINITY_DN4074_c0_g1_i1.p1  ORF type:complete len:132 (-),score=18.39 TRINITY_DN4074_c0_g1_i1:80-475(-)